MTSYIPCRPSGLSASLNPQRSPTPFGHLPRLPTFGVLGYFVLLRWPVRGTPYIVLTLCWGQAGDLGCPPSLSETLLM